MKLPRPAFRRHAGSGEGTGFGPQPLGLGGAWQEVNRRSFGLAHGLAQDPRFSLERLLALAQSRPDDIHHAYWSNGQVAPPDRWEKGWNAQPSLANTIAGIAGNDSLVMLRHLEDDPLLGPPIAELFAALLAPCSEALRRDVVLGRASVIIASPGRVTPYHIDADCNFLLQLAGRKRLYVLDAQDRELVPDHEIERFFAGDFNGAQYKPECQARAAAYDLGPGDGVHIPCTAPHWGANGGEVSIALSMAYDLRSEYRRAKICLLNGRLRHWGLQPLAPGRSAWRDALKLGVKNAWGGVQAVAGRRVDPTTRWGWRPSKRP